MPRPTRCRRIEKMPLYRSFSPDDALDCETIRMTVDEFETLRILDSEGLTQEACAQRMDISRTTVTAIYESARKKVADALTGGKRLVITGGCCSYEPVTIDQNISMKGNNTMRIAVTYENGEVFQHFGHTEQFMLYDEEGGKIVSRQEISAGSFGHGALAGLLQAAEVDALICGGIGMGARMALEEAGIKLYAGVSGSADAAAQALAEGKLDYDPESTCDHHDHHHENCGSHEHRHEHGHGGCGQGHGHGHGGCGQGHGCHGNS